MTPAGDIFASEDFANPQLSEIIQALLKASVSIYDVLSTGKGLEFTALDNASGDEQIGLDIIADNLFFENLKTCEEIGYIVSEERPDFEKISDGRLSVTLDPLDGSKAAMVGIPSGAIFGIFNDVEKESDFIGDNVVASGFFVFGMHLEAFFTGQEGVYQGRYDLKSQTWSFSRVPASLGQHSTFAVNAANQKRWPTWFQKFYFGKVSPEEASAKPYSLRWYGSMVSEIKRVILQGGVFAYPEDTRPGYDQGHLRLVYEAIPMAFLLEKIGGLSSNGNGSILNADVQKIHQKTPVYLGEAALIQELEALKKAH